MTPARRTNGRFTDADAGRLNVVITRLSRQISHAGYGADFTGSQMSALTRLEQHGTMRLGELASLEGVVAPSLSRTIAPLITAGLVTRDPDPTDGRSALLTVTSSGRDLLRKLRRQRCTFLANKIERLSSEQQHRLGLALPELDDLLRSTD